MARACFAFLLALALSAPAAAQSERTLDIERLRPSPDGDGFLGIPSSMTPGPWAWNVALWNSYSLEPLTLVRVDTGERTAIVRHRVGADLIAQLGITDRIATLIDVPIVVWQKANAAPLDSGPAVAALAFRDPYLAVRVRILGDRTTENHDGGGLALQAAVTLPFGLEQSFAGEGNPQIEGAVLGDFHFLSLGIGALIGYRHRFAEPSIIGVGFANELFFGVGIQSPLFFVENLTAIAETRVDTAIASAAVPGGEIFYGPSTAVETDLGVRWAEGELALTWAVGSGFGTGTGAPSFRGFFGVSWAPRTHDADGDGIRDEAEPEGCRRLPEDRDGFEDDDGCPDPDNDNDFVPDEDDRCPNQAAEFGHDEDEDGCNDAATEAPPTQEPEGDRDHDSVLDSHDRCPDEAEDRDEFQDDDGCPDPDNDSDGVNDADDRCPGEAEDRDSFEDADGCIDPDNDRDGVIDASDRCPDAAETINGIEDEDGCADRGGRSVRSALGTEQPSELRGRIRFGADGAVAEASTAAVQQLAHLLIARWGARWTIAVPEQGSPARADTLRQLLLARSVPTERFEIVTRSNLSADTVEVRRTGEIRAP